MSNPLLTFVGWSIVPSFATRILQSVYYGITIRAGDPKPAPGSPRFIKHYRRIQITLIVSYLCYTVYEASHIVYNDGNFYRSLGVPHDLDDRGIKSRFRKLAALHHPDKSRMAGQDPASDTHFVHLKLAQDTLLKPAQRFAYDRFGPDMLLWEHCSSIRDYLSAGARAYFPMYFGSTIMLVVLGATGYLQWGRFWRYILLVCLIVLDMYTVTRPYPPPILQLFVNPILNRVFSYPALLPFQFLVLARSLTFTLFIALSQLGPHLQTKNAVVPSHTIDPVRLNRLEHLVRANEMEAARLLDLDLAPYAGDQAATRTLKTQIREWLVQNTIRADLQVRKAVGEALNKRRVVS